MPPVLALDDLTLGYGAGAPVLSGINLAVAEGEVLALVGANGAGKSTLLRSLLRLNEPISGRITLLGEDVRGLSPRALRRLRARVGLVFQKHNLVPRISVLGNVLHGAIARGAGPAAWFQALAPARLRREAMDCLEQVGLAHLAARRADRLSGGQSQRVAIARVLMQRPAMILADEPTASLDPAAGEEVMSLLAGLARAGGHTCIFTSHDLDQALRHADRVVGLRGGGVALDRPTAMMESQSLAHLYA